MLIIGGLHCPSLSDVLSLVLDFLSLSTGIGHYSRESSSVGSNLLAAYARCVQPAIDRVRCACARSPLPPSLPLFSYLVVLPWRFLRVETAAVDIQKRGRLVVPGAPTRHRFLQDNVRRGKPRTLGRRRGTAAHAPMLHPPPAAAPCLLLFCRHRLSASV